MEQRPKITTIAKLPRIELQNNRTENVRCTRSYQKNIETFRAVNKNVNNVAPIRLNKQNKMPPMAHRRTPQIHDTETEHAAKGLLSIKRPKSLLDLKTGTWNMHWYEFCTKSPNTENQNHPMGKNTDRHSPDHVENGRIKNRQTIPISVGKSSR